MKIFNSNITLLSALLILTNVVAKAQSYSDTLNVAVYFPCGSSNIAAYPDNLRSLGHFINRIDSVADVYTISPVGLSITSSTSPEGSISSNRQLSHRRSVTVLDYLNSNSASFRAIAASAKCRIEELTTNHLLGDIPPRSYADMRFVKVALSLMGETKGSIAATSQPLSTCDSLACDSIAPELQIDEFHDNNSELEPNVDSLSTSTLSHYFFIKTNLLYDLLTMVNVSVEVPLSKRFTVEATVVHPWWRSTAKHKTLQLRYVALTPRFYFKDSGTPFSSLFAGLSVGAGSYDLQWTRRGVQGKLWHIAPTFGYSHHISRRWKMEYSASVGYVQTKYTKYTQTADTPYGEIKVRDYPWVSHVLRTVLPISLNVSIVYTIGKLKQAQYHGR